MQLGIGFQKLSLRYLHLNVLPAKLLHDKLICSTRIYFLPAQHLQKYVAKMQIILFALVFMLFQGQIASVLQDTPMEEHPDENNQLLERPPQQSGGFLNVGRLRLSWTGCWAAWLDRALPGKGWTG